MNVEDYDKILKEIQYVLFSERKTKKLNKLDPNFYSNVRTGIANLKKEMADNYTANVMKYMQYNAYLENIIKNFKAFFQVRLGKIAKYSVFDLDGGMLSNLTMDEKEILNQFSDTIKDYYNFCIGNEIHKNNEININGKSNQNVEQDIEYEADKPDKKETETAIENYLLVRLLKDMPPIAQPDRNYYLHKNDIIYIKEPFANILNKLNAIAIINKK